MRTFMGFYFISFFKFRCFGFGANKFCLRGGLCTKVTFVKVVGWILVLGGGWWVVGGG